MGSSYKGIDLFGSGPHRFSVLREGELVVAAYLLGGGGAGGQVVGKLDIQVVVRGRLAGRDDAAVWSVRDALSAQAGSDAGTLIDLRGHRWERMTLVNVEWADRVDHGRVVSIEYAATFRRLA
jgi:hypothetical protein